MVGYRADTAGSALSLLAPDEPAPFESLNDGGGAPLLVICDHASAFIPRALGSLGLDRAHLARHIALDIGAAEVARRLAERLDAPAVLSRFSRLIVDPNRTLDAPSLIPTVSDGVEVPGNRNLLPTAREARIATFHQAYHEAVEARLAQLRRALTARRPGGAPALISVHSFTPVMAGQERPWHIGILWNRCARAVPAPHIGILWNRDPRLPRPLIERLRALGLTVGDNQPYTGRDTHGYSVHRHAEPHGLANVLIEVRQDLSDTHHGAAEWSALLAGALEDVLTDPGIFEAAEGGRLAPA